jgi:hypothetical protein
MGFGSFEQQKYSLTLFLGNEKLSPAKTEMEDMTGRRASPSRRESGGDATALGPGPA